MNQSNPTSRDELVIVRGVTNDMFHLEIGCINAGASKPPGGRYIWFFTVQGIIDPVSHCKMLCKMVILLFKCTDV